MAVQIRNALSRKIVVVRHRELRHRRDFPPGFLCEKTLEAEQQREDDEQGQQSDGKLTY
jgi:hypothetical protein